AGLAMAVEVHPLALMLPAAMAANCAFMLPVGTPPNAIVFGTGKISIQEMAKAGFGLNLIALLLIVVITFLLLPIVYGIDLNVYPSYNYILCEMTWLSPPCQFFSGFYMFISSLAKYRTVNRFW